MKGIKKTLMAGVLACTAFNAQAEVSPLSYGIKAGGSASSFIGYGDAKIGGKQAQNSLFGNIFIFGNLYAEYAITDYVGFGIEPGYMKQGGKLEGGEAQQSDASNATSSISMTSHGITLPLYVSFYPLGREEGEGILKVSLGGSGYIPFSDASSYKKGEQDMALTGDQKKEYPKWDIAGHIGVGYEFPFGLSIEGKYGYGFRNRFNTEKPQTIFTNSTASVTDFKNAKWQHMTVGFGYNIGALFSE